MRGIPALLFLAAISPCRADTTLTLDGGMVVLQGALEQGGLVRGAVEPGTKVMLDGHALRVAPDGSFIFGFGRDAADHAALDLAYRDGRHEHRDLAVTARQYEVQRVDGLPQQQVTPDPAQLERIKREAALINKARAADSDVLSFEEPLRWPVLGPISGIYGSQRILNGEPRQPHSGIDIAAPAGSPVIAAAGGNVTLAEPDLFFTGMTVIIDHGYGLSTIYQHLSRIDVAAGQHVEAGDTIGAVGATGRVTGPHLHWGLSWYDVRLDPALAAGAMPSH